MFKEPGTGTDDMLAHMGPRCEFMETGRRISPPIYPITSEIGTLPAMCQRGTIELVSDFYFCGVLDVGTFLKHIFLQEGAFLKLFWTTLLLSTGLLL
jgi:hypothetical protein